MNNFSIKKKLLIISFTSIIGLFAILFEMHRSLHKLDLLMDSESTIHLLESDVLMLRRNEKDFIIRKDLKYKDKFSKNTKKLYLEIKDLLPKLKKLKLNTQEINNFESIVKKYEKEFYEYVQKQEHIGLNHKSGLYGSLRNSVHEVQTIIKNIKYNTALALTYELRKHEKDFMLRKDLKYVNKFENSFNKLYKLIQNNNTRFNQSIKIKTLNALDKYKKDMLLLVKNEKQLGLTSKDGIQGQMRSTIHKTEELLKKITVDITKNAKQISDYDKNLRYCIAFIIILLVISIALYISNKISKDIHFFKEGLLEFFRYLNKESEDIKLLEIRSNDEIAQMSQLVNENIKKTKKHIQDDDLFIEEVMKMVEEVNKGYLSKRFENKVESQNLEKLRINMNTMLENLNMIVGGSTNKILDVLNSFAKLDFTNEIKNDKGKIPLSLNNVNQLITQMLIDNKSTGLTLKNSSDKLMDNVQVLSNSSNTAATSLEETAAALEEITSNIVNNTENIIQMANYANELDNAAKEGEKLASKTNTAMDEINLQVEAINEAITLIDQIAFQTNILSLNAAVEAATAGEAGKGFAVVAGEVRNLASRSADVATEIKDLVQNATSKANEGKYIANSMINGYNNLNKNIHNTIELISNIETASKEQKEGIEQINDAVNSLDQQTQQNAQVASQTKNIAQLTLEISNTIVKKANEKNFLGKDEVKGENF